MLNTICLWVGRIVVFGGGGIICLCLVYLLWTKVLQYFFFKIKHLFPWWWWTQDFVEEWKEVIKTAKPSNWRKDVVITQKGRFVKWYCPTAHFGCRTEYILIKK